MRDDPTAGRQTKGEPLAPGVGDVLYSFSPARLTSPPQVRGEYTDPVCGMVVDPEETPSVIARELESVYFCSRQGQDEYLSHEKEEVEVREPYG